MDSKVLVMEQVEAGRRLLEGLDARGMPVTAAYWFLELDGDSWKYVVATPRLDEDASFEPYRIVNEVIDQLDVPPAIEPIETHLLGEHAPIIVNLRAFAATGDGKSVRERKISGEPVGSSYILGAYLYRVKQLVPETGVEPVTFAIRFKDGWMVNPGELELKQGRLVDLRTEDMAFRDISIRPKSHPSGLSASFDTVEKLMRNGQEEQTLLRRWRFSKGILMNVEEEIDPLSMKKRPRPFQKSG